MDALMSAIYTKLNGDTDLGNLASSVRFFRRPESPQQLVKPVVVFNLAPGTDEAGLHGAASNIAVELEVWGYQHNDAKQAPDCVRIAQRLHEIFVSHKFTLARGGHTRWNAITKFTSVPQQDPDVVLLRGTYNTRYWSGGSIDEIIAQGT